MSRVQQARVDLGRARANAAKSPFSGAALDLNRLPRINFGASDVTKRFVYGAEAAVYKSLLPALDPATEQRLVVGIVLEPTLELASPDTQGDCYSADEVAAACASWTGTVGLQHQSDVSSSVEVVSSIIMPCDAVVGGQTVHAGTWILAVKVLDDALWASIKSQAITGWSIGGTAVRSPIT